MFIQYALQAIEHHDEIVLAVRCHVALQLNLQSFFLPSTSLTQFFLLSLIMTYFKFCAVYIRQCFHLFLHFSPNLYHYELRGVKDT